MIGKIFKNFIIFAKGYKLTNYFDNEFFKIIDDKIVLYKKAFGLKNNEIVYLEKGEYLLRNFQKILITSHLNKGKFLNDLIYDNEKFICLEQLNIKFECQRFKTKYSSFKEAEEFVKKFLKTDKFILVFNELFMNAYEHGNLGLSFEEKEKLIKEDRYFDFLKIESDKEIEVCIAKEKDYIFVMITDEGNGFELKNKNSLFNGRGIKLCEKYVNLFYNKKGNSVLFIGRENGL